MFTLLTPFRLAAGLIALYALVLAAGYGRDKGWLIDSDNHRRPIEYVAVRAAGELAAAGMPAAAYDWEAHKAAHDRVVGKSQEAYYTWPYPPTYLVVADGLARLPYVLSALLVIVTTGALFAHVAARLIPQGAIYALGAPTTMINAAIAHTGFLIAGLFGLGLLHLRHRPLVAGALFGLLSFKPQIGLLIPIALIAARAGRAIIAATGTALAMIVVSVALYGIAPWQAMPAQLDRVVTEILRTGQLNFDLLTTLYGALRRVGVGHEAALVAQGGLTLALAAAVYALWRGPASDDLKAAALLSASVLATPYLFIYDLTLLVAAMLFLVRDRAFDAFESSVVLAGGLLLLVAVSVPVPVGFIAACLAGGLICRRAVAKRARKFTNAALAEA